MNMPQFIEPHEIPTPEAVAEAIHDDMARSVATAMGVSHQEAKDALDAVATAVESASTPEEAAAAALAAAEQLADDLDRAQHDYAPERDAEHDQAVPAAPPMPAGPPPVPLYAGTYAIYDDDAGGVMLVVGQSTGEVVRKHIPAAMMKMAERFGGAGSGLAGLFGGR